MLGKMKNLKMVKACIRFCDIFTKYEVSQTASSIAYFFILAIFPFLMFLAALVGLLNFPDDALATAIEPLLTKPVADVILSYYTYLTSVSNVFSLVFGFVFSLFSASRAVQALNYGINKVYHTQLARSFWEDTFLSVVFALGMSAVLFLALFAISTGSNMLEVYQLNRYVQIPILNHARYIYLVAVVAAFLILTAFYAYAPVAKVRLRYAVAGSGLCIVGLHLISIGVGIYVRMAAKSSALYGTIGAVIIMLLWLYLFGICVMLGALLNRYIETKTRVKSEKN